MPAMCPETAGVTLLDTSLFRAAPWLPIAANAGLSVGFSHAKGRVIAFRHESARVDNESNCVPRAMAVRRPRLDSWADCEFSLGSAEWLECSYSDYFCG